MPGDGRAVVGGAGERARPVEGGEVVQPDLDGDRAPGDAVLAHPGAHLAGLPGQQPLHQLAVGEVGVVGALDADRLGLPLGDDRARCPGPGPAARARGPAPGRAAAPARPRLTASRSATVWMPARRSRSAVAGPTPGITVTFIGRSRSSSVPGGTTVIPSGLSSSLGDLGEELRRRDADRRGQPAGHLLHPAPEPRPRRGHGPHLEVGEVGRGEVDERLVERERLDQRGQLAEHLHDPLARLAVGVEPAGEEGRVRAAGPRLAARHRRPDAELRGPRTTRSTPRRGHRCRRR